jgi:hypothetical protein
MVDFSERAARLRVLWNRGRNIYSSFYTELDEARREIGDARFADWCFNELRISLSILNETVRVLKSADAGVVKAELARARDAEKEIKKEMAAQNRQAREEAHARRVAEGLRREEAAAEAKANQKLARRYAQRKDKKEKLRSSPPVDAILRDLLAQAATVEKTSRVELGRLYAAMKQRVHTAKVGNDEHSHPFTWKSWVGAYIRERTLRDVNRCIEEYMGGTSCPVAQSENVFHIHKTVA